MNKLASWLRMPLMLVALFLAMHASAQVSSPDSVGPYAVSSYRITSAQGFGGGTAYYPQTPGRYGVVAVSPGFFSSESAVSWFAQRLASHGFVAVAMNTNSIFDFPPSRANQLMAVFAWVANTAPAAVASRADSTRRAVAGHSMGGGGSLIAAQGNPSLRAVYPLTPWNNTTTDFSRMSVPTMIIGADGDTTARVSVHARPFYASLPATTRKAYGELNGATHGTPNRTNTTISRYSVSWMKRFVDADMRYSTYLCGAQHQSYNTPAIFDRYQQSCPY